MSGTSPPAVSQKKSFTTSVLWNWSLIALNVFTAFGLTPYLIRRLGDEGYGVWTLTFSMVEYYWLLDFGFRSATARFVAHYQATDDTEQVNRVISTGLAYFTLVASVVGLLTVSLAPFAHRWFQIAPPFYHDFTILTLLVGLSWSSGAIFMVFQAGLEGFQRFDLSSRIFILSLLARVAATVAVLWSGGGLVMLGAVTVASQVMNQVLTYIAVRRVFPPLKIQRAMITRPMLRQMASYGVHTVTATLATQLLNQSAPVLIARFYPTALVGYFNVPVRLMQLTGSEVAARVGLVSTAKSAELCARGDYTRVEKLAVVTNRYCLMLFLAPSVVLLTYGAELLGRWLGPLWAVSSAPLLPAFIAGTGLAVAAQFNSSSILYGLAKHGPFARGLLAEAIAGVLLLLFVLPRYGLIGAAWSMTGLMIVNRGLYLPWVLCRVLNASWIGFLASVLVRPVLGMLPALAAGFALKRVIPGTTWLQLGLASLILMCVYLPLAIALSIEPEHRRAALNWARNRWSGRRPVVPAAPLP